MNNTLRISLTLIQALLFAGLVVFEYLSGKYMTMMRIALYQNRRLVSTYPMEVIMIVGAVFLFLIGIFALYSVKPSSSTRSRWVLAFTALGSSIFMAVGSVESMRTYYIASMLLAAVTVIQVIKLLPVGSLMTHRKTGL